MKLRPDHTTITTVSTRRIGRVNDRKPPLRLVRDDGDVPLQARIQLAVSILQQRNWHADDRRHVNDVLGALLGKSIDQLVDERERCDDR